MSSPFRPLPLTLCVGLLFALAGCGTVMEKNQVREPIAPLYTVADPPFRRAASALLGPGLVPGNRTTALPNGDAIFPAMLGAIRGARQTVHLETYIFWQGEIGDRFAAALAERARAGVKVRVILDWQGSRRIGRAETRTMADAGVEIVRYHPPGWYDLRRVNNRTHRKLLIVDGRVGFTGGVGLADLWRGNADAPEHWRDTQYRVEGPVVAQLQAAFLDNWVKARGEVLHGNGVFPPLSPAGGDRGGQLAQAFKSSPGLGNPAMRLMFLLSIAAAGKHVQIESPYFVPDNLLTQEFVAARRRGVRVEILVPGRHIDSKLARAASRSRWGPLLEAGVEIYEYGPTMIHAKLLVVDGQWTSVGSSNFDDRSFRLNDEANLNVLDRRFAAAQAATFEADKARARRVTLDEWRRRPLAEKLSTPFDEAFRPEL